MIPCTNIRARHHTLRDKGSYFYIGFNDDKIVCAIIIGFGFCAIRGLENETTALFRM